MTSKNNFFAVFLCFMVVSLFIAWPDTAFAYEFEKNPDDISYYYLGQILGPVGNLFNTTSNDLLGKIFKVFNIAILTLGSIIVMYTVVVSTIHTAQEGEAMGRKFGSLWVPIKAVGGLAVLLPTTSGYSLIQILMTWIILQGVWAANGVYTIILDHALSGASVNQATKNRVDDTALSNTANAIFKAAVCKEYLNDPAHQSVVENQQVTVYEDSNNSNLVYVGVQNSGSFGQICGTFTASPPVQDVVENPSIWVDQQKQAVQNAIEGLNGVAQEAATIASGETPTGQNIIQQAKDSLRETILATPAKQYSGASAQEQKDKKILEQAKLDGWLYAGSYYFQLIKPPGSQRSILYTVPGGRVPDANPNIDNDPWSIINSKVTTYLQATTKNASGSRSELDIASGSGGSAPFAELANLVKPIAGKVIKGIEEADPDPLVAFATVGGILVTSTEAAWIAILAFTILAVALACWGDAYVPACAIATCLLSVIVPLFMLLIVFLWSAGVMMALYLPLVPYLVFTFTAIGWMMLVVETVVAAPIVALGIVTPAQDALGKAAPAVMLITNVFLRPSLMLVGFIAGAQLLIATFRMVNFSFIGSMNAATENGSIGIFGVIVVVILYVGVMTTIVNQVFSLIYVLPDKVIRWIGGHAEQSSVERAMGEAHRASESGAKSSGDALKQSGTSLMDHSKSQGKKQKDLGKKEDKANKKAKEKEDNAAGGGGGANFSAGPGPSPAGGGAGGGAAGAAAGGGAAGGAAAGPTPAGGAAAKEGPGGGGGNPGGRKGRVSF